MVEEEDLIKALRDIHNWLESQYKRKPNSRWPTIRPHYYKQIIKESQTYQELLDALKENYTTEKVGASIAAATNLSTLLSNSSG